MTTSPPQLHPVDACLDRITAELTLVRAVPMWTTSREQRARSLSRLKTIKAQLAAVEMAVIAQADVDNDAAESGAVNTAALVRSLTRVSGSEASRTVKTARALDGHVRTAEALAAGKVTLDQATEILAAVDALPPATSTEDRARAEHHLLDAATVHDARELRRLGTHLLEVLDPDHADQLLAVRLEKEEARAARKSYLEFFDRGDGSSDYRGNMTNLHRAMAERYLGALMNPHRPDAIDLESMSRAEARGQAFGQLLERIPADHISRTGGVNATVVVTMTLESLLGGLKAASLDTGGLISARQARRLACAAGVIPAVLDGDGAVLDLGPQVRFHTPKQRLAMNVQQGGTCAVEDCDRPAWICDGAHLVAWQDGGHTSVENGALVCPRHHTLADSTRYKIERIRPGRIRLVRRQ